MSLNMMLLIFYTSETKHMWDLGRFLW